MHQNFVSLVPSCLSAHKDTKTLRLLPSIFGFVLIALCSLQCSSPDSTPLKIRKDAHILLIGNNLGSRMMNYGYFETEMHVRYPDSLLFIRNMCDGGDTPGFRPHSGRVSPWAFPGAEKFQTELATNSGSEGHFETPDQWLTRLKADIIIAFFGYNESFQGEQGLENYRNELDAFIKHSLSQAYNGKSTPQLAIVSPIAFENANLSLYAKAMKEVAAQNNILYIDAFNPTKTWYDETNEPLTIDGSQLNNSGYSKFSKLLADKVFGKVDPIAESHRELVHAAVLEKNWMWHNDYKIPNGMILLGQTIILLN
jgi:hypothetical protein